MIQFDEKFFEGEERDGFYVTGEMKRVWAAQMEVLMEVDRVCKKHNIKYFADSGTLLGAVRHNGFIPWDDDMDIAMLRSDFMKFITVASKELEKPIRFLNIYQEQKWDQPFGRVTNSNGITLERKFLERFHGCPYYAGVDVFVLDNLPLTESEYETVVDLYAWIWNIKGAFSEREKEKEKAAEGKASEKVKSSEAREADAKKDEDLEKLLEEVETSCKVTIDRKKNIVNQLVKIVDGLFAMYGDDETDQVANMAFGSEVSYQIIGRKREWYRESVLLPFENIMIPVPIDFYKAVVRCYGENYLTPVKKWHFHDYPYYKEAKKIFEDWQKDVRGVKGKMDKLASFLEEAEG